MDYTKSSYVQEAARLRDRIDGKDLTKIFFTSDTHFGHGNIINFCKRPYENVAKMDNALIENWNATVGPTDDVYHLGDFCFNGIQRWWELIGALNGRIHLILGNHDLKYIDKGILYMFCEVEHQKVLYLHDRMIYLNHVPFLSYGGDERGNIQLYGHVHSGPDSTSRDLPRLEMCYKTQYDVGVDNNGYKPISLHDILCKIE